LYSTRQRRLLEQKTIKDYEERERMLKDHLISTLPKSESTGAAGRLARANIVVKAVPVVEDWGLLYRYIKRKNRFDLLQRRLNDAAVQEMWDNGETVPGVGSFNLTTVSVTKV
jgi:hypothetical protein